MRNVRVPVVFEVLLPEEDLADLPRMTVEQILEEADVGGFVAGPAKIGEPQFVSGEKLVEELRAMGNDGSFFDEVLEVAGGDASADEDAPQP